PAFALPQLELQLCSGCLASWLYQNLYRSSRVDPLRLRLFLKLKELHNPLRLLRHLERLRSIRKSPLLPNYKTKWKRRRSLNRRWRSPQSLNKKSKLVLRLARMYRPNAMRTNFQALSRFSDLRLPPPRSRSRPLVLRTLRLPRCRVEMPRDSTRGLSG